MADAEPHRGAPAQDKKRDQLSPEEQRMWDDLYHDYNDNPYRGVATMDAADMFQPDMQRETLQKSSPSDGPVKDCPQRKREDVSLMNLDLEVNQSAEIAWDKVVNMINKLPNCDPMVEAYSMMGNYYVRGTFCEFLLGMFQVDGSKKVLDFKRMSGSGFVLDSFFRTSKEGLQADGLINKEDEEDGFDGDAVWEDGVYSDGSDDEGMETYGYLQFNYDPKIVTSWIEKMKVRHVEDKNHMMGLLAYNANNAKNLEIIVREGGTNLRNMILLQLEESNSAALVRNTAALLAKVTTVPEAKNHDYDADFVTTVMYTIVDWCPKPRKTNARSNFEISESRETVMFLLEFLENVKEWVGEDVILEKASALKPEDADIINNFLQKRAASVNFAMKLFPDAMKLFPEKSKNQ